MYAITVTLPGSFKIGRGPIAYLKNDKLFRESFMNLVIALNDSLTE